MNDAGAVTYGLDIVVHEVRHDEQMDDLRGHEPVSHVLGEQTHCLFCVQLRIGEDPEDDEEDSRNSLGCNEVGCVGFDVTFLNGA